MTNEHLESLGVDAGSNGRSGSMPNASAAVFVDFDQVAAEGGGNRDSASAPDEHVPAAALLGGAAALQRVISRYTG